MVKSRYTHDVEQKFRMDMKMRSHGIQFEENDEFSMWINLIPSESARKIYFLDDITWGELCIIPYVVDTLILVYGTSEFKIFDS